MQKGMQHSLGEYTHLQQLSLNTRLQNIPRSSQFHSPNIAPFRGFVKTNSVLHALPSNEAATKHKQQQKQESETKENGKGKEKIAAALNHNPISVRLH